MDSVVPLENWSTLQIKLIQELVSDDLPSYRHTSSHTDKLIVRNTGAPPFDGSF